MDGDGGRRRREEKKINETKRSVEKKRSSKKGKKCYPIRVKHPQKLLPRISPIADAADVRRVTSRKKEHNKRGTRREKEANEIFLRCENLLFSKMFVKRIVVG